MLFVGFSSLHCEVDWAEELMRCPFMRTVQYWETQGRSYVHFIYWVKISGFNLASFLFFNVFGFFSKYVQYRMKPRTCFFSSFFLFSPRAPWHFCWLKNKKKKCLRICKADFWKKKNSYKILVKKNLLEIQVILSVMPPVSYFPGFMNIELLTSIKNTYLHGKTLLIMYCKYASFAFGAQNMKSTHLYIV